MSAEALEMLDIAIIGAGFSGIYAVKRFKDEYKVHCFEAGSGVGGTWFWNRYPGARVDIKSVEYSYGFDDDLQQEWDWPEMFSAQPDLERYANHVVDRFGLRDHISLNCRVETLHYDEASSRWLVGTSDGKRYSAKYVIAATGALSAPHTPPWPGLESFQGQLLHTTAWPREGVDVSGKRVGFIGTGSTGIQAMPILAKDAASLTVFQRTPAFCMPSGNGPMDPAEAAEWKAEYPERRKQMLATYGVSLIEYPKFSAHDLTAEEREEIMEAAWHSQSAFQLLFCFSDVMSDPAANEYVAEFVRQKIRSIVKNPEVAERLCPKDYPIGGKRLCIGNGYYEMYNLEHVRLVDVRSNPITEFTPTGLKTATESYDFDIIVTATGFDAVTGAMSRIDIRGLGGQTLQDKWAVGPTTYMGALIAGFPNLFMIHGPLTAGAQAQMITTGEWQVNWTADTIAMLEERGISRMDTTLEAEKEWAAEVDQASQWTVHRLANSWYNGANIEGKQGGFMIYVGGFDRYADLLADAVNDNYRGFTFA